MAEPGHPRDRGRCISAGIAVLWLALLPAIAPVGAPSEAAQASGTGQVVMTQPPKPIDDFELTDQEGRPFEFSQLRGRAALLFFGFTHCPDVCPGTLLKLRALTNQVPDVAMVMISVDGDRDSPAVMKAYLEQFSARFLGLTGDPTIVRRIAQQFPAVFFKGLPDRAGSAYSVAHTSQVYLIDREGRLRATFFDPSVEVLRDVTALTVAPATVSRSGS